MREVPVTNGLDLIDYIFGGTLMPKIQRPSVMVFTKDFVNTT